MEACSISQHVLHHGEAGEAGGAEPRALLLWVWDSPGEPVTFPQLPQAEPLTLRTPASGKLAGTDQHPPSCSSPVPSWAPRELVAAWCLQSRVVLCSAPQPQPSQPHGVPPLRSCRP